MSARWKIVHEITTMVPLKIFYATPEVTWSNCCRCYSSHRRLALYSLLSLFWGFRLVDVSLNLNEAGECLLYGLFFFEVLWASASLIRDPFEASCVHTRLTSKVTFTTVGLLMVAHHFQNSRLKTAGIGHFFLRQIDARLFKFHIWPQISQFLFHLCQD